MSLAQVHPQGFKNTTFQKKTSSKFEETINMKNDNEDGKQDGQWETPHVYPHAMWTAKQKGQYNEKALI